MFQVDYLERAVQRLPRDDRAARTWLALASPPGAIAACAYCDHDRVHHPVYLVVGSGVARATLCLGHARSLYSVYVQAATAGGFALDVSVEGAPLGDSETGGQR